MEARRRMRYYELAVAAKNQLDKYPTSQWWLAVRVVRTRRVLFSGFSEITTPRSRTADSSFFCLRLARVSNS